MPRDARAYLSDVIEACDAITNAVRDLDWAIIERDVPILRGECVDHLHRLSPPAESAPEEEAP